MFRYRLQFEVKTGGLKMILVPFKGTLFPPFSLPERFPSDQQGSPDKSRLNKQRFPCRGH